MTSNFDTLLAEWKDFRPGHIASEHELAAILVAAQDAKGTPGWLWAEFAQELDEHGGFRTKKDAQREVKRCRMHADLGCAPPTAKEFVAAFLASRAISMTFSGIFSWDGGECDYNYILNEMLLWSEEMKEFSRTSITAAFQNWVEEERERLLEQAYESVAFDPTVDPEQVELRNFVRLMVAPVEGGPLASERNWHAAEVALANFVHRVKNHMRKRWTHSTHLMPVFYGTQGTGKTTAVQRLLAPIEGLSLEVGFEMLDDNSSLFQIARMPVMFFDELAGVAKADVEKLKGLMTTKTRQLREAYARASAQTIVSTFIGCTNRDLRNLIKDETGNRRFLQLDTNRVERSVILAIDPWKIWRSVDEDAEAPLYADAEALAVVQEVQAEQRHRSPVEHWLDDTIATTDGRHLKATELFAEHFFRWLEDHYPGQTRFYDAQRLGLELAGLVKAQRTDRVEIKVVQKANRYRLLPRQEDGVSMVSVAMRKALTEVLRRDDART